jgi:Matrixin
VRWNPCLPIHYSANLAQASDPAGALADLQAAVEKLAAASGLTFVYDGPTTVVPTSAWLDAGGSASGIVIAYAASGSGAGQSDLYGADADGEGGWWESGTSTNGSDWVWQIMRGFVVLDPAKTVSYAAGFGGGVTRGALLMHELGHAVGLGHAADQADVMFPVISASSHAAWGPGDLRGLALVGKGAGCIT